MTLAEKNLTPMCQCGHAQGYHETFDEYRTPTCRICYCSQFRPTETPPTDATTDTLEAIDELCRIASGCAILASNLERDKDPYYANEFRILNHKIIEQAARIRAVAAHLTPGEMRD